MAPDGDFGDGVDDGDIVYRRGRPTPTPSKPGSTRCWTRRLARRAPLDLHRQRRPAENRVRAPLNRAVGDPGRRRRRVPRHAPTCTSAAPRRGRRRPTRLADVPRPLRPLQPRQASSTTSGPGSSATTPPPPPTPTPSASRRRWSRRWTTRCSTRPRYATPKDPRRRPRDFAGQYVTDTTAAAKQRATHLERREPAHPRRRRAPPPPSQETKLFADYVVDNYATPQVRVGQLTVKSRRPDSLNGAATWALLCGVDITDIVHLTTTHGGGGGFDNDFYVEGIHYQARPGGAIPYVELTLDVSPARLLRPQPVRS